MLDALRRSHEYALAIQAFFILPDRRSRGHTILCWPQTGLTVILWLVAGGSASLAWSNVIKGLALGLLCGLDVLYIRHHGIFNQRTPARQNFQLYLPAAGISLVAMGVTQGINNFTDTVGHGFIGVVVASGASILFFTAWVIEIFGLVVATYYGFKFFFLWVREVGYHYGQ